MANEISVLIDMNLANGKVANSFDPGLVQVDQTTARMMDEILSPGASVVRKITHYEGNKTKKTKTTKVTK